MKRFFSLLVFILSLFAFLEPAFACTVGNTVGTLNVFASGFSQIGQSFTATCSGNMTSISVQPHTGDPNATLNIYNGSTAAPSTPIFTQTGINLGTGIQSISLSTPVPVTSGNIYTFILSSTGNNIYLTGIDPDAYSGGQAYVDGFDSSFDFYFSVAINPPATAPGAPTGVGGTSGNAQVSLSWTTPSSDGGSAITGYNVQVATSSGGTYSDAAGTCAPASVNGSTGVTCTATGLTNGTTYYFKVAAINAVGTGSYSSASSGVTPATTPGAPTGVGATFGNGQAAVSWTAPASNGGSAITGYNVQVATSSGGTYSDAAGTCAPASVNGSTGVTCAATGLTNGTTYYFKVAAINAVGTGSYSSASSGVTPATTPGAPTGVGATFGNGQAAVSWTAPASNGGSAITGYNVQVATSSGGTYSDATGTCAPASVNGSTGVTCTATGLTNGTPYYFKAAAINAVGTGSYSSASSSVTPLAPPVVTSVAPNAGDVSGGTSVVITGTAFTNASAVSFGGTPATTYTVNSSTQITATSPAGTAGTVDIFVTTPGGTSTTGNADRFTYAVRQIAPAAAAAGGGTVSVQITGGSPSCSIDPTTSPIAAPANFNGITPPRGAMRVKITGCGNGDTVTVAATFSNLNGMTAMKYGKTPTSPNTPVWYTPNGLSINGNVITYTVTDNGLGDDTFTGADGIINDPIIPLPLSTSTEGIPTLSEWGLMLLASLMAVFGLLEVRRRQHA